MDITSVLPITGQVFPRYFERFLEFFADVNTFLMDLFHGFSRNTRRCAAELWMWPAGLCLSPIR